MTPTLHVHPLSDPNRLGLNYRHEATRFPYVGPIWDVHTHMGSVEAARLFFEVADLFNVDRVWTMAPLRVVDDLTEAFGERLQFIAVPDYTRRDEPGTFTTQWLDDIRAFAERGCRICKFWAAPRGRDLGDFMRLDHPIRLEGMKLARDLGMMFMAHIADPDTWFASHYADHHTYGLKAEHYEPFERLLDEFHDVPWIAAHMAGHPEDLEHVQQLLDHHPNLYLDTSATKWQIRELSKHPDELRAFCQRNVGRILFGTDIVANTENMSFDLYASRFWALRTLLETAYEGPSPIVDPDLSLLDPTLPPESTATLRGANLDATTLSVVYHDAAKNLLPLRSR